MRHLPLRTDYTPTEDVKFNGTAYPATGIYQCGKDLVFVYDTPGAVPLVTNRCVFALPGGTFMLEGLPDHTPKPAAPAGISESFVLKAMAIAQNPSLAKDLVGD